MRLKEIGDRIDCLL